MTSASSERGIVLRDLDASRDAEVRLVAERMRATLVDVLGAERGGALYTMEWLIERVRWHLDPNRTVARVVLAEHEGVVVGHAIARTERGEGGAAFGYFSTVYVVPAFRKRGVATTLMSEVERWLASMGMPRIVYNTATHNERLLRLFARHGYRVTATEGEMVQLTKPLSPARVAGP